MKDSLFLPAAGEEQAEYTGADAKRPERYGYVVILLPNVILRSTQSDPVLSLAGWQRADILASRLQPSILTV